METYSYPDSLKSLDLLLEQALRSGMVRIKYKDGNTFIIKPDNISVSPLDVEGININISTDEIINIIRESRECIKYDK